MKLVARKSADDWDACIHQLHLGLINNLPFGIELGPSEKVHRVLDLRQCLCDLLSVHPNVRGIDDVPFVVRFLGLWGTNCRPKPQ